MSLRGSGGWIRGTSHRCCAVRSLSATMFWGICWVRSAVWFWKRMASPRRRPVLLNCARGCYIGTETLTPVSAVTQSTGPAWHVIRCPICRSTGSLHKSHWQCSGCGRGYPRYSEIVDFRVVSGREDLSFAHLQAARDEKDRISRALNLLATVRFAELIDNYFREFPTRPEIERGEKQT